MKRRWTWIVGLMLVAVVATATAQSSKSLPGNQSDPITDKDMKFLVGLCESCHGKGGKNDRTDVPTLAGRDADELFAEIERFYFYERVCPDVPVYDEDGSKGHMSMCDVVNQMNKQEAMAVARYFEGQPAE